MSCGIRLACVVITVGGVGYLAFFAFLGSHAFPPPVDLDAYAAACRLPPAEETEDEREARFQRERFYGL